MISPAEARQIEKCQHFIYNLAEGSFQGECANDAEALAYAALQGKPLYLLRQREFRGLEAGLLGLEIQHTEHYEGAVCSVSYQDALERLLERIARDSEEDMRIFKPRLDS